MMYMKFSIMDSRGILCGDNMRNWDIGAVILFMILLAIPIWGLPLAALFAWIYCHYLDNKR